MHVAPAPARRLGLAELDGVVEVGPALDHLGAERAHRGQLDRVGRLGNEDRGRDAEQPGRVGDRLPVVAGGGGQHAGLSLRRLQRRDQIDPAPHLEGAGGEVILMLDVHLGADQVVEQRVVAKRRAREVGSDAPASPQHISELGDAVDGGHGHIISPRCPAWRWPRRRPRRPSRARPARAATLPALPTRSARPAAARGRTGPTPATPLRGAPSSAAA